MKTLRLAAALSLASALGGAGLADAATKDDVALSGAIFTTTIDGGIVNENVHYDQKTDVYLDGGPGPGAPVGAAALPAGDYYFQVTDPSGKDLLSTDHISCRKVHVNSYGVISLVYAGTNWRNTGGGWVSFPFQHFQGVDQDHAAQGAITVQLFPFDDTPNPGGEYKVWFTRVEDYEGRWGTAYVPSATIPVNGEDYSPANCHGFIPARSKTDNFKVRLHRYQTVLFAYPIPEGPGCSADPCTIEAAFPRSVTFSVSHPLYGAPDTSYFEVSIVNNRTAAPATGTYAGNCADADAPIAPFVEYRGYLLVPGCDDVSAFIGLPQNMNRVNWILNEGLVGTASSGGFGPFTYADVQVAIWILLEGSVNFDAVAYSLDNKYSPFRVAEILAGADTEGASFVPSCGDVMAVLLAPEAR